ncbi:MAG: copper chaperone [Deferribacteres bacterium]|jgi:copper chaperone|nr:copper ion binding protein [Deferribacteraceae bacterium]MDK2791775.1 copper chaperone [Deferribacteres bacterium]
MKEVKLTVNGMSCHHCKNAVESSLKKLQGVENAEVNLAEKSVKVIFDEAKVNLEKIYNEIEEAGYEPVK